jgi:sugar phosphate isomerase/epimerase
MGKIGIFAKTFAGSDPHTVLGAVKAAGYSEAAYNMACSGLASMPDAVPDDAADAVRVAAETQGVAIVGLSATYNMIHPDIGVRETGLRRLGVLAEAAPKIGTRLLTLCTGTRDPEDQWRAHPDNALPEAWRDLLVEMEKAVEIAERYDVKLGIEPEFANVVRDAATARRLLDTLRSDRLVVVLDPANLFEHGDAALVRGRMAEAVDLLGENIGMAHAKDRDGSGNVVPAGRGIVDFADFVRRLRAAGFGGPLVTHGLEAGDAPAVARFLEEVTA